MLVKVELSAVIFTVTIYTAEVVFVCSVFFRLHCSSFGYLCCRWGPPSILSCNRTMYVLCFVCVLVQPSTANTTGGAWDVLNNGVDRREGNENQKEFGSLRRRNASCERAQQGFERARGLARGPQETTGGKQAEVCEWCCG